VESQRTSPEKIQEPEAELEKVKDDLRTLTEAKKRERYGL